MTVIRSIAAKFIKFGIVRKGTSMLERPNRAKQLTTLAEKYGSALRANASEKNKYRKLSQGRRECLFIHTHLHQDSKQLTLFHSLRTHHSENTGGYV